MDDEELDAFDLAQLACTLARIADREFPLHRLDGVRTVADFTSVVGSCASEPQQSPPRVTDVTRR